MFKRLVTFISVALVSIGLLSSQCLAGSAANAQADSAVGYWLTMDHQHNNAYSSVIRIERDKNGKISGRIVHIFPIAGHNAKDKCVFCKGKLHNAPIMGLKLVWGFDKTGPVQYGNGYVLDPTSGKVYKCKMWLSQNGQQLTVHGYIGISLIGRSDVWLRTHPVAS